MLEKFFIICSGADKPILDACPTEKTKFVGIGATIFLTAVFSKYLWWLRNILHF